MPPAQLQEQRSSSFARKGIAPHASQDTAAFRSEPHSGRLSVEARCDQRGHDCMATTREVAVEVAMSGETVLRIIHPTRPTRRSRPLPSFAGRFVGKMTFIQEDVLNVGGVLPFGAGAAAPRSEEQQAQLLGAGQRACARRIAHEATAALRADGGAGGASCPPVWDGILCWQRATPGQLLTQRCPAYIAGFHSQANASKLCTESGEWYSRDEGPSEASWTNFSLCFSGPKATVIVNVGLSPKNESHIEPYLSSLKIISQMGYAVSLLSLLIAFIIFSCIKKLGCPRNVLHMHLFASLYCEVLEYRSPSTAVVSRPSEREGMCLMLLQEAALPSECAAHAPVREAALPSECAAHAPVRVVILRSFRYRYTKHSCVSRQVKERDVFDAFAGSCAALGCADHAPCSPRLQCCSGLRFVQGLGMTTDLLTREEGDYFNSEPQVSAAEAVKMNWLCRMIISIWQYFIMANYSWILMEGLYLHNLIFLALFSDNSAITLYIALGWGCPSMFVLSWIICRALLENTLCWTTNDNTSVFLLIRVPTTASIVVSFLLFINIVRVLLLKLKSSVCEETKTYRRWAKSTLVLVPLFGVHYMVFLTLHLIKHNTVEIVWLFCDQLFASFNGFFVALLYCFLNGEVRCEIAKRWNHFSLADLLERCTCLGHNNIADDILKNSGRFLGRNRHNQSRGSCYSSTSFMSVSVLPAGHCCNPNKKRQQSALEGAVPASRPPCAKRTSLRGDLADVTEVSDSVDKETNDIV
ncbi:Uncharacterized protein GBIM_17283 [Gryllus bimaculatus]|nr:Uncharacterized protein GBIM_17283 [Gryllus bimaculatus]